MFGQDFRHVFAAFSKIRGEPRWDLEACSGIAVMAYILAQLW